MRTFAIVVAANIVSGIILALVVSQLRPRVAQ